MDELREKLERYIANARPAFAGIEAISDGGVKVKDTAECYFSDALHFMEEGELVNAFAALEYAEGWLDSGIVLGVVKAPGKNPGDY